MIGQVLVAGRPGWRCWGCGAEWQIPPHQDAAEYQAAERAWMQAHKGCGETGASVTDTRLARDVGAENVAAFVADLRRNSEHNRRCVRKQPAQGSLDL